MAIISMAVTVARDTAQLVTWFALATQQKIFFLLPRGVPPASFFALDSGHPIQTEPRVPKIENNQGRYPVSLFKHLHLTLFSSFSPIKVRQLTNGVQSVGISGRFASDQEDAEKEKEIDDWCNTGVNLEVTSSQTHNMTLTLSLTLSLTLRVESKMS